MEVKIGCDIVAIKKFGQSVKRGKKKFLERVFTSNELLRSRDIASLAGMFAAKEAVIKATGLKAGDWLAMEVVHDQSGKPRMQLANLPKKSMSHDISISHDKNYALAFVVFLL